MMMTDARLLVDTYFFYFLTCLVCPNTMYYDGYYGEGCTCGDGYDWGWSEYWGEERCVDSNFLTTINFNFKKFVMRIFPFTTGNQTHACVTTTLKRMSLMEQQMDSVYRNVPQTCGGILLEAIVDVRIRSKYLIATGAMLQCLKQDLAVLPNALKTIGGLHKICTVIHSTMTMDITLTPGTTLITVITDIVSMTLFLIRAWMVPFLLTTNIIFLACDEDLMYWDVYGERCWCYNEADKPFYDNDKGVMSCHPDGNYSQV